MFQLLLFLCHIYGFVGADVPVVINAAINEYLVCEPYRKLTSRTPHVENFDIYGVVFPVRKPNRREMNPVIVGRIFILPEKKLPPDFSSRRL